MISLTFRNPPPSVDEFRKAGFDAPAGNFPLSPEAYSWLLAFYGVPAGHTVAEAWKYAPNAYMQRTLHEKATGCFVDPRTPALIDRWGKPLGPT